MWEGGVIAPLLLCLALGRGEWLASYHCCFILGRKKPLALVEKKAG